LFFFLGELIDFINKGILDQNKTLHRLVALSLSSSYLPHREKRSATFTTSKHKKHRKFANLNRIGSCRKFDFNVNFVDLGWEKWIIFPKIFNAHFCGGSCSLPLTLRQKSLSLSTGPISSSSSSSSSFSHSDTIASISQPFNAVQVTNHAQIMSILEYKHPEMNQQMAKCVSTKLKPLTVIFLDEYGQIKTKQYEDMIVDECGCR
jgi:hypothetical protein